MPNFVVYTPRHLAVYTSAEAGSASVDEHRNAIRDWADTETVVSYFFRANECGKVDIALEAKGQSRIEVSLLGKKRKITLQSDELSRVDLGTFKIKKPIYVAAPPGHIRVDVRGVKINEGEDFGSVAAIIVRGEIQDMSYITTDFNSHFGRRGPSVHLGYVLPLSVAPRPLPGTQERTRSSRTSAPCRAIATARHTIRTNGRVLSMAVGCP